MAHAVDVWQQACPNSIVVNLYGQTEAPIGSLVQTCTASTPQTKETGGMPLGKSLPGLYVDIIDQEECFAAEGIVGEIALAGPHISGSYLDDPVQSKNKFRFLEHPVFGRHTWYLTGDLGRKASSGIFHFLGRADNQLKIGGFRFMLEEIEFHLREISECKIVAVVPIRSDIGVEAVAGFIVGDPPEEQLMKEALLAILPRPLVPRMIKTIEKMPLSLNGKIDRKSLEMTI